jgi:hypothetical protein
MEILNDRGYKESDPQAQPIVWERMNLPIARGLRGLIYVLWDLSQVDPSDLSILFAGDGRLRMGFAEIDPPAEGAHARCEPSDELIEHAAQRCCDNPYYAFHKPAGTSLICIQGDWSNVVDAKIKGRLAAALGVDSKSPYSPLYARSVGTPKPWGVTALFAEYTGAHPPLEIDWSLERSVRPTSSAHRIVSEPIVAEESVPSTAKSPASAERPMDKTVVEPLREHTFSTFWEFAVAVNRSDPAALALASNGATSEIPIDGPELRRLLGMMWFRTVLARLSPDWRNRILEVLVNSVPVPDHAVKVGRHTSHLRELSFAQLQEIGSKILVPDSVRADMDLLITVGRFWGAETLKRFRFIEAPERHESLTLESLLERFRG